MGSPSCSQVKAASIVG